MNNELPLTKRPVAERVLAAYDEEQLWISLLGPLTDVDADKDQRKLAFDALRYLTDRRDGKPVQPLGGKVDLGLDVLAEKIAAARARGT